MHLAQLNVATLRYSDDDPRVADFMNALDLVNGIAKRSEGFVWRYMDESGNATSIELFDDPKDIINMSVWENAEAFEKFVWQTVHKRFYGRRREWFKPANEAHFVMWWIEEGHIPTVDEAFERLELLRRNDPTSEAFGWESLASVKLWREARCG